MTVAERYEYHDEDAPVDEWDPGASWPTPEDEAWLLEELKAAERSTNGHQPTRPPILSDGWPTLDPKAMHGLTGDLVRTLEPHTEADPVALLVDALVCFGNAAGSRPHAIADGARHPARLNAVLVGKTAKARKGTSRANVGPLFAHADRRWSDDRVMGGLSTGEGLIAAVADPPLPEDGTEAPAPASIDKRLLVLEPEFARVLAAAKRETSTLSHIVREAWDTGTLRVMTRKEPLRATGAHVSVLGHITAEELRRTLTSTDQANGFANRFLFVCVTRSKMLPEGGGLDDAARAELGGRIRTALAQARNLDQLTRTPAARDLWADLYRRMGEDGPGGIVDFVTSRREAQTLRLSVAYAIADGSPHIDVPHLEAAWALWSYCDASARYLFGDNLGDEVADKLLAALRAAGPEGLDGTQQSALFGRHVASRQLEDARALLQRCHLADTTTEQTGGRPRIRTTARGAQ